MERWHIITAVVFGYLLLTLTIGLLAGRGVSKSVAGYVAADRGFGLWAMYFVMGASVFSAFAFLGGPGWAYSRGAAAFYILGYGVLGIVPWYFMGPKAGRLGRRFGYVTQAQLVVGRFPSRLLSVLFAVVSVAAFVPYLMVQMSGAGIVFSAVTQDHIPFWLGAALAYGTVVIYVLFSGVAAVGWTNIFQGMFMMAIAWGLGLYIPISLYGSVGGMFERIASERPELLTMPGLDAAGNTWSWGAYSSALLSSALGFLMWPHLFMKSFSAKSDDTMRRTVILFPTFQLFLIPILLIGFAGVLFPVAPATPDFIMPHMILETGLPALVVGLFCAGALAASMSTGDALLHGGASIAVEDGVRPFMHLSEIGQRRLMRVLVVALGALAYYLAIVQQRSLVWLLLTAYGVIDQLAPPVYAALYWRRATTAGVLSGLGAGIATTVFFFLNPELRPWEIHEGLLGVVVNVAVLVSVSLLTRPQDPEHAEAFVAAREAPAPITEAREAA
ncbi:MAG TPA: sodium:solute symporter family protein [Longimicrobiales bacterium]|nr:sodium:solute symporter family protein [Longimicrobiales bacterium]